MPECTNEEREFLDQLKKDFNHYRTADPDEWEEDDDVAGYFTDDFFYALDTPTSVLAENMCRQWAESSKVCNILLQTFHQTDQRGQDNGFFRRSEEETPGAER